MRYVLLLALVAIALPVRGQIQCQDGGVLDPSDNQFYPCEGTAFLGRLPLVEMGVPTNPSTMLPYRGNDIWGWHDTQTGSEYALVGNKSGMFAVDVTDPLNPAPLGSLPTATVTATWRDIKVYQNTAYIVADGAGSHGIQVFDLTRLRGLNPDPRRLFTADAVVSDIGSAHNVFVNQETGFLYTVGSDLCVDGPVFFDLSDPLLPVQVGCYDGDGYTHDVQCVLYSGPDPDYQGDEICLLSNEDTLTILNVTDKAAPVQISQGLYPNFAYVHQGWFGPNQRYWYQDDEADELQGLTAETRTIRFDLEDLDAPTYLDDYLHGTQSTDHNLYTVGDFIYLSNNTSGLRVLEVSSSDPSATIQPIGFFDTYPENDNAGFEGAWSVYPFFPSGNLIVSDRSRGLFVLDAFDGTTVASEALPTPDGLTLALRGPNPFRGQTQVRISAVAGERVEAVLFDVQGRRIATVYAGFVEPGRIQTVTIDGAALAPGLYVLRVSTPDGVQSLPLVRTR